MSRSILGGSVFTRMRAISFVAALAAVTVAAAPVLVDFTTPAKAADVPDIIKKRQATMKRMGAILGSAKNYADGKADQATALKDAEELPVLAKTIPDLFPKGTGNPDFPGVSGTKAELWDNPAAFEEAWKGLDAEAPKLIAVIQAGDPSKVGPELGEVNKAGCNACHNKFRMRI